MEAVAAILIQTVASIGLAQGLSAYPDLSFPVQITALSNPDGTCWTGMDLDGTYVRNGMPVPVDPFGWLLGQPPSEKSGVTMPTDHWIELGYSGHIADGPGPDILITEHGKMGEYALICLTDIKHWPYPIGIARAQDVGGPESSFIEMELAGIDLPFKPNAIRIVSLGLGGASPGFDVGTIKARVVHPAIDQASCPNPPDNATGVDPTISLSWQAGIRTGQHILYLARDLDALKHAGPIATLPAQAQSFQPGTLQLGQRYYWRVDQVDKDEPQTVYTGPVWSFTTSSTYILDNFETPRTTNWRPDPDSWFAEYSVPSQWPLPSYSGCQSLIIHFKVYYEIHSSLVRTFEPAIDWASMGARYLVLAIKGQQGNPQMARLFIRIGDGHNTATLYYTMDPYVLLDANWRVWRIPLDEFKGIDLSHVSSMAIGVWGKAGEPAWPVEGWMYVDQIILTINACDRISCLKADLDCNCQVDHRDLAIWSHGWLAGGVSRVPIREPNSPIAWYQFEGNANDSIGSADGELLGNTYFVAGKKGLALATGIFASDWKVEDRVRIPNAGRLFSDVQKGLTIAFWQQARDSTHYVSTLVCSDFQYGLTDPAIMITIGCWDRPGYYQWSCGRPMSTANTIYRPHDGTWQYLGRWNHWAFTKDFRTGRMSVLLNGRVLSTIDGTPQDAPQIQYLDIGNGWLGHYDGYIDELQIYDYGLSEEEVAYLASDGTGTIRLPPQPALDLDSDGMVRWQDFALLARQWLTCTLWP
ncbi:MAG: hypothetical protein QHH07_09495 [Sedimentisphaerales bacterium]|nr:hypothetical protein [Sedimentisphaerales bacterium]